jgi:hypothetical protein
MKNSKWAIYAVALGLMLVTGGWLQDFKGRNLLGPAGVKVGDVPIYGETNNLVSDKSIVLPQTINGMSSWPVPIANTEQDGLPKDTTFGRRYYRSADGEFGMQVSVVLMGRDHTSIHQPQYCLYAQDWSVTNTERIALHVDRPFSYDIPAVKLTAERQMEKTGKIISGIYVYWFVSGDKITSEEGSRLWSMWKTILQNGQLERWAYISYFTTCLPGREQATYERLKKCIEASAPDFQLVTGKPDAGMPPLAAQK